MKQLTEMPNIGVTLSKKLNLIGVMNEKDLQNMGSEKAIMKITTIENGGACINMLFALEGAIQGIRWHDLSNERKCELRDFFRMLNK